MKRKPDQGAPIWDLPEPERRPAPSQLTREKIVRAALAIADEDGISAVSLRNVGAALKSGPMRLYPYISTKEDLLALMVDALYGEMQKQGPLPDDWMEAMRVSAQRLRKLTQRHPWFVPLLGGRPPQGPNALSHLESLLAVLFNSGSFSSIDMVLRALKTVQAYVIGTLHSEASEAREAQASGLTKTGWQKATADHLFRVIESGRIPTIAKVVEDASHPPSGVMFAEGLDCVLEGVATRFGRKRSPRK